MKGFPRWMTRGSDATAETSTRGIWSRLPEPDGADSMLKPCSDSLRVLPAERRDVADHQTAGAR